MAKLLTDTFLVTLAGFHCEGQRAATKYLKTKAFSHFVAYSGVILSTFYTRLSVRRGTCLVLLSDAHVSQENWRTDVFLSQITMRSPVDSTYDTLASEAK